MFKFFIDHCDKDPSVVFFSSVMITVTDAAEMNVSYKT